MDKFDNVCIVRQKILDELNRSGQGNSKSVAAAVGISMDYAYQNMASMCTYGECEKRGRLHGVHFVPLKTVTTPAAEMRKLQEQNRAANKKAEQERVRASKKSTAKWHYVHSEHRKPDDPPLKNQGGQGSVRHTSWARSEGSAT